ncbi:MAG TPA: type 4a pilus biogenesis protein PilO, partial [Desulfobacteria bacterium]|nr:type 4a pilus biogenesis protein PilO [Desulfobacteria bacterium]
MALKLDDLSKVPPRQKILLAVLFCGLVVTGYYYLYYREASQRIGALETQLAGLQSKIREQQAIAGNLRSFQDEVRRLEGQLSLLLEQLPNSAEIPSLLKSVSDLGKESGLEFLRFAPSGEIKKDFYAEIPVAISVNGDYHSFALFTDKVAHYPRIVNLSNIAFSSPKPSGDNLVL